MNQQLGAGIESAKENAERKLLSTYEWRLAKKSDANGNFTQETIKLVDATDKQLKDFHLHCMTMLNNSDSKYPGRRVLLNIIKDQREKCNAELFFREFAEDRDRVTELVIPIKTVIEENNLTDSIDSLSITSVFANIPEEYDDLPLNTVIKAGERRLGLYDRTYMTLSFILSKGLELSESERDRYADYYSQTEMLDTIKEEIKLRNCNIPLTFRNKTGLTIAQLQYLLPLTKKRYVDIPTDILVLLRNKMLPYLESDIKYHIGQWEERAGWIEAVAKSRGLSL